MIRLRQAIVVEGRYDKSALAQLVDAPVFTTEGFSILHNREKLQFLRQVAQRRGLIILTDSDGAGFVIRNYLRGALPKDKVKHAYIPDVEGKEKRKSSPSKEGKLGVEGMKPEALLEALRRAGATLDGVAAQSGGELTKADLFALGLSGGMGSALKRKELLKRLELPEKLTANALLDVLNALYGREELISLLRDGPR